MVLNDIARDAGLIEIVPTPLHAKRFRHGDLNVIDILLIPKRLKNLVGEPQHENVLNRLLAEVVIDPVYLALREDRA